MSGGIEPETMITRALILPCALLLLLGSMSCGKNNPDQIAQNEIRELLYNLSQDFNRKDMARIMDRLHSDYLHKGMVSWSFNQQWLEHMGRFALLDIEVLFIETQDNKAVVHSVNTFTSSIETLVLTEPETVGDISYFIWHNGQWLLYGNQEWIR
ncbi:MAG TPA: hypothetical protein PKI59_01265 [Candidatus Cloacimonadota bacterium]|nr:hypothetical protein [Candidatus Cloacimonadota bacterium]